MLKNTSYYEAYDYYMDQEILDIEQLNIGHDLKDSRI